VIDNVDTLIEPSPDKIIYYFAEYQPMFDKYLHIVFRQGVPKSFQIEDTHDALVILDDIMIEADQKILNVLHASRITVRFRLCYSYRIFFSTKQVHAHHQSKCSVHSAV